MYPAAVWILTFAAMAAGLVAAALPGIPGAPIILAAAAAHKLLLPGYLSWWTLGLLAGLAILAFAVDTVFTLGGAKRFGATRWGMFGSAIGGTVGLIGGLAGVLAGAVLGAALAEIFVMKRPVKEAARAGAGAGLGLIASTAGRVAICLAMIAAFLADAFLF